MTNRTGSDPATPARRLVCARCDAAFSCDPGGACWCMDEAFRLPMPADGQDCLCPTCLRAAADWAIGAVLLDMDGTLLDTERIYLESLTRVLTAFGYPDATAIGHAMIGIPGPECEIMLRDHYGDNFPVAEIDKAFVETMNDLLQDGLPLKPGALELLDALAAASMPMAIVTSSSRRTAETHLTKAGIRARFNTVLTRDDVARGKPSPDLYLLAAATLGVPPQACIAIEDSAPGIASAQAAGTIPILVPDVLQPSDETRSKCAAVLIDLHAVLALLRTNAGLGRLSAKKAYG